MFHVKTLFSMLGSGEDLDVTHVSCHLCSNEASIAPTTMKYEVHILRRTYGADGVVTVVVGVTIRPTPHLCRRRNLSWPFPATVFFFKKRV